MSRTRIIVGALVAVAVAATPFVALAAGPRGY